MNQQAAQPSAVEKQLLHALHDVEDPEFPMSVVDMGLVYKLTYDSGTVSIDLTFTAMGCPGMEFVLDDIRQRLLKEDNVETVHIAIVWSPPWTKERLSPAGRDALMAWGISV